MTTATATVASIDQGIAEKTEALTSLQERLQLATGQCAAERERIAQRVAGGGDVGTTKLQSMELERDALKVAIDQAEQRLHELKAVRVDAQSVEQAQLLDMQVERTHAVYEKFAVKHRAALQELRADFDRAEAIRREGTLIENRMNPGRTVWSSRADQAASAAGMPHGELIFHIDAWLEKVSA